MGIMQGFIFLLLGVLGVYFGRGFGFEFFFFKCCLRVKEWSVEVEIKM